MSVQLRTAALHELEGSQREAARLLWREEGVGDSSEPPQDEVGLLLARKLDQLVQDEAQLNDALALAVVDCTLHCTRPQTLARML